MNNAQRQTARSLRANLTGDQRINHFYRTAPGIVRRGDSEYDYQIESYSAPTQYGTINIDGSIA